MSGGAMPRTQWASGFSLLPPVHESSEEEEHMQDAGVAASDPVHHSERSASVTQWSNGFTTTPVTSDMHGGFAAAREEDTVVVDRNPDRKRSQWSHGFSVERADELQIDDQLLTSEGKGACVSVSLSAQFPCTFVFH